jgi:hypothetical protein
MNGSKAAANVTTIEMIKNLTFFSENSENTGIKMTGIIFRAAEIPRETPLKTAFFRTSNSKEIRHSSTARESNMPQTLEKMIVNGLKSQNRAAFLPNF